MKKLLTGLACFMMVVIGSLTLVACGGTPAFIRAADKAFIGEGESAVEFVNAKGFAVTSTGDKTFKATGAVSTMNREQAIAFWDETHEGDTYVVLRVDLKKGDVFKYGFVETAETELGAVNDPVVKEYTAEEDGQDFVLAILKTSQKKFWKLAVTAVGAEEATIYTVDMTGLTFAENA